MANELDEMRPTINEQGRDINVIEKQLPVTVGVGSTFFEIALWFLGIIPGLIFLFMKISAKNYLQKLQQKIQHDASQIDNYLEQRVIILQNAVGIVNKAIDLDKDVMKSVAALRSGKTLTDGNRAEFQGQIDTLYTRLNLSVEQYPELKAHASLADAMQQNSYLQKEITAAREVYNDTVMRWNQDIFDWPTKQIVAARAGYTTRIPFTASKETKEQARGTFF
ncbi:MAG: LemA family protein [Dysgonamonadaceae bacterium]|jgi:LemA protein|nr:LemA family protein [Dysgonamonadaceae bacterium]